MRIFGLLGAFLVTFWSLLKSQLCSLVLESILKRRSTRGQAIFSLAGTVMLAYEQLQAGVSWLLHLA